MRIWTTTTTTNNNLNNNKFYNIKEEEDKDDNDDGDGGGGGNSTRSHHSSCRNIMVGLLRQEKEELRQALIKVQENYQEVQQERNFYRVKVSELAEILETRQVSEALVQKTVQVADLLSQVDRLNHQLETTTTQLNKMKDQREQYTKMLLELSDIVRTLQGVPVPYTTTSLSKDPLQNVKTKVETIMEDRRLLVLRCQELEEENQQYQKRIQALEAQFHLLNALNMAKADLPEEEEEQGQHQQQESLPTKPPVGVLDRTLSAMSIMTKLSEITTMEFLNDPLMSIEPCPTDDPMVQATTTSTTVSPNNSQGAVVVVVPPKDQHVFRPLSKQNPDNVSCVTATSATYPTFVMEQFSSPRFNVDPPEDATEEEAICHQSGSCRRENADNAGISGGGGSFAIHPAPSASLSMPEYISDHDSNEVHRLQWELEQSRQQHQQFKQVCHTAFQKMKVVEQEYNQMRQQCDEACSKRDALKEHLKDVIQQYKDLNKDYEQAMDELEDAKSQIKYLENSLEEVKKEKEYWEDYGADILDQDGVADNVETLKAAYLTARKTIQSLKEQLLATQSELKEAEQRRIKGDRNYRDAIAQTRKLQHEQKILETRIADAKEQIQIAKKETQRYKEEAKHTRRRLTAYMQKEGIPTPLLPQSTKQLSVDEGLLIPELLLY